MRYKAYRKVLRNFFVTSFGNDARRTLTTDRARKRVREVTAGRNNAHLNEDRKDLRQLSAGLKSLELLRQSAAANERKVFSNLTHLLSHDDVLLATYIALRKKGNASMTVGVTRPLSFNIDDLIVLIRKKQLQFRHKPPPRQKALLRIGELYRMNPLSRLPTAEDTILEVMGTILDALFEPKYDDNLHGYRSTRTCHTALQSFRLARGATFILTLDLRSVFDKLDIDILIDQIRTRVDDPFFEYLIRDAHVKGWLSFTDEPTSFTGVPRGNKLSATATNVYFSQLDRFVRDLRTDFRKLPQLRLVEDQHNLPTHGKMTKDLWYIRYASSILIAIRGTTLDVYWVQEQLRIFFEGTLRMKMPLADCYFENVEHGINFLGAECYIENKDGSAFTRHKASIPFVIRRLSSLGLCRLDGEPMPKEQWKGHDKDLIVLLYNRVADCVVKYYSFADNYPQLVHRIQYIIRHSCASLLAQKFRLISRNQVFRKFGSDFGKDSDTVLFVRKDLRTENVRDRELWQSLNFFKKETRWWV